MDLLLPPQLTIARSAIRYIDQTGVSGPMFGGPIKTAALGWDRIGMDVEFTTTGGKSTAGRADQAALIAFLAKVQGRQGRIVATDNSHTRRGVFSTGELISNSTFSDATGWSASSGALVLAVSSRSLRSNRNTNVSDETIRASALTVTSGVPYVFRVMVNTGFGPLNFRLRAGTSAGGNELAADAANRSTDGLATLVFTTSGTTLHVSIQDRYTGKATENFMDIAYASVARCALVKGASQTGNVLLVDNLPTTTNEVLLPGDQIEVITSVGSELKVVTAPVHSVIGTEGYIRFSPPLRNAPADNAPVIIHSPFSRFIARNGNVAWSNEPGVFTRSSLELEECE